MKLIRKQFLIVSTMMSFTIVLFFSLIYFAMPTYYNQLRQDELKNDYLTIVNNLDGKPQNTIIKEAENNDKKFENLFIYLYDYSGKVLYPNIENEMLSEEDYVYLEKENFDQVGVWSKTIYSKEETPFILQVEYAFNSLPDITQGLVTFYPFILLLIVVLTSSVAFVYSHLSNKRIMNISEVARQMQELKKDISCQISGKDEIAFLAQDVNRLYDKLLSSIEKLELENKRTLIREKQKSDFLRMTSHELKTPISSMLGLIEGMIYNVGDFKNHDLYLKKCRDILYEQSQLVQSILDATNIDIGAHSSKETFNLDELIMSNLQTYIVLAEVKKYKFSTNLKPVEINANKTYILKAIKNLLDNVFRYTVSEGFIKVSLDDNHLVIENQAEHILNEDELEQIFQPFYRPDFSRNRKDGGTGIGLYLVQQILESHCYSYRFEAIDNKFMRFTIYFSK